MDCLTAAHGPIFTPFIQDLLIAATPGALSIIAALVSRQPSGAGRVVRKIRPRTRRTLLAVMIAISLVATGAVIWQAGTFRDAPAPSPFTASIDSPVDGGQVVQGQEIRGTVSRLPADRDLWVVIKQYGNTFPLELVTPDPATGQWSVRGSFGDCVVCGAPENYKILLVVASRSASTCMGDYLDDLHNARIVAGIPYLPEGAGPPIQQIEVTRV